MYQFTGSIINEWRSEPGVNIAVKGLNGKIVVAPRGPYQEFDKKEKSNTLTFTVTPSSGTTGSPRAIKVEVENGTEKVTTNEKYWEVALTGSKESTPAKATVTVFNEQK